MFGLYVKKLKNMPYFINHFPEQALNSRQTAFRQLCQLLG